MNRRATSPTLTIKYAMETFFCLLFEAAVYLRMRRDQISIQDRTGILFFQAMNQAFGSAIGISKIIPQQLKVVSRERAARAVHAAAVFPVATPRDAFFNSWFAYRHGFVFHDCARPNSFRTTWCTSA